jgi:hypothetical protein
LVYHVKRTKYRSVKVTKGQFVWLLEYKDH